MKKKEVENTFSANTAAIISEVFTAPREDSVIYSFKREEGEERSRGRTDRAEPKKPSTPVKEIVVASHFKLIFISVLLITIGTLIAEIAMVWGWTSPTPNQQTLMNGVDSVWKGGVGAILGLLGGKTT